MERVIIRVFDTFSSAEQAREALLAAGFERSGVELTVRADEAGGTKGNFTVGNYHGAADGPVYERDFAHERMGGDCVLTVTARDAADAGRAAAIMQRYGAIDRAAPG
ncbi:MAG: hypothetical protein JWQ01_3523 [Massilia sp.]|jgi:hypothetical protein|nr:hypothetical protein [Massilia sp.]